MRDQTLRSQLHHSQISQQSLDSILKDLEKDSDMYDLCYKDRSCSPTLQNWSKIWEQVFSLLSGLIPL